MGATTTGSSEKPGVFVLSVGRDLGDAAGGEAVEALEAAGFAVVGRDMVPLEAATVESAIARRLGGPGGALLVVGGATAPGADHAARAAAAKLAWAVPGLAEAFRALALPAIGADALLATVVGGVSSGRKLLFAVPDGAEAARLATSALVAPLLDRLAGQLDAALGASSGAPSAPSPAPTARGAALPARVEAPEDDETEATVDVPPGVSVSEIKAVLPDRETEEPKPASGWRAALRSLGATLERAWPELPESLERLAPVRNLLDTAGQRGVVVTADGRRYGAYGFPDLQRDTSKVLLVREAEPMCEVIALHRHPRPVGVVVEGAPGLLPSADEPAGPVAERLVQRAPPVASGLWAVDQDAVYLFRDGRVWRWDGRRETLEGTPGSALGSLLLRWSQK